MPSNYKYELQELQKGLAELELREMHPCRVYRPTAQQLPIHESQASEVIVVGGKRCLAGWSEIYDPVALKYRVLCEIDGPFHVSSRSPTAGAMMTAVAGKPFTKGYEDFYEITLSNGYKFDATHDHQVLTTWGWMAVGAAFSLQREYGIAPLVSSSAPFPSGFPRDGRGLLRRVQDYQGDYFAYSRPCDEPLPSVAGSDQEPLPSLAYALEPSYFAGVREGGWGSTQEHTHLCQSFGHPSTLYAQVQTSGPVASSESLASYTTYSLASSFGPGGLLSPPPSSPRPRRVSVKAPGPSDSPVEYISPYHKPPVKELEVIVTGMRYLGKYTVWDFEVAATGNYEMGGIVHHNSGKTLATVMEFGSRVLGIPIAREDGTVIKGKRFKKPSAKSPKLYWVIGLNVDHIGQTLYHRLFSPGLGCDFRIIKDSKTEEWRAYNPNLDAEREDETVLCPPMFGDSVIDPKSWHMESAAGNIFKSVRLMNGATICAYATTGDYPKQGDAVDGIWLDEDTANAEFLKEWHDRLSTRRGWWLWSVWPKVANEALINTLDRAKKHEDDEQPPIKVIRLVGSENPYSDKAGIAEALARMDDDDDEAHRDRGDIEAFISGRQMYDFGTAIHVVKPMPEIARPTNPFQVICKLLSENRQLPQGWTRYLAIDPSHTRTACLFGVVPPAEWDGIDFGDRLIIEKELVVTKHTPAMFAGALVPFTHGIRFEAFIMDQMVGRQTTVGSDVTVFAAYEREFRARGIVSRITGSGFMRGSNDKSTRRRAVRTMLEPIAGGLPTLWVSRTCNQTIKEFHSYRKKEIKDSSGRSVPLDDPVNERVHDCMASTEYLCEYIAGRFRDGTAYVEPQKAKATGSLAYQVAMGLRKALDKVGEFANLGPPGGGV